MMVVALSIALMAAWVYILVKHRWDDKYLAAFLVFLVAWILLIK